MKTKFIGIPIWCRKKLLILIMKTFIFLFSVISFGFNPVSGFSQNTKIIIDKDKVISVEEVFELISEQTDHTFFYRSSLFTNAPKVALKKGIIKANDLLQKGLSSGNYVYKFSENGSILIEEKTIVPATKVQQTINGKVVDQSGVPLLGANILVKGTSNGTQSDFDGNFTLDLSSADATLVVSYIGYLTKEVVVGNQTNITITLAEDAEGLDEVVLVGYTTQNRKDITGAISSVNVADLQKLPGGNVANLLQGQVSGVISTPGSGAPGSAPVIRIRGLGTIGNNNPLFVIDGIPGDISGINPADIESINVLKDASAATIYGSRASNGVVIVTTKRGKTGDLQVSFNSYIGFSSIPNKIGVLNTAQNNQVSNAAHANDGQPPLAYTSLTGVADTDWQDEMFRNGFEQKYDFAVSGGTEKAKYNMSLGYFDSKGTIIESDFTRYNFRINTDFNLSDRIRIGQTISYARSERSLLGEDESGNGGNSGFSPILGILQSLPHNSAYDPSAPNGFASPIVESGNIVGQTKLITDISENDKIQGNVFLEVDLIEGLKFRTRIGANISNNYFMFHAPTYQFGPQEVNDQADLSETRSRLTETIWNNVLEYTKTFNEFHNLSVLAGLSYEKSQFKSTGGSNNNFPSNDLLALGAGIGDANSFGSNVTSTLESVFGQLNYDYKGKYLINGSVRRDGSSRFGPKNRHATFASFSLGWRVTEEDFFDVDFISDLKPRFSLGTLGNQNIGNFLFLSILSSNNNALNYPLGSGESQLVNVGTISRSLSAEDIKWEESRTTNVGLDIGLFSNRVGITFDYFNTKTTDMLVGVPIPATTGITIPPVTNAGTLENKGWELTLSYKNSDNDFKYSVLANIGATKNKITKLGFQDEAFTDGFTIFDTHPTTRTEVGGEIGRFYLFNTDGIFQNQAEIDAHGVQPNASPGDLRFVDTDNNGELNDDDRQFFGSGLPDFEYGMTFNASYKAFDFSLFLQGSQGNEIYNGTNVLLYRRMGAIKNFSTDFLNAWTPSNTGTSVPRVTAQDPNQNIRPSNYFLEDGSYLRIKNIQLGYTIDGEKLGITRARVYVSAENLATFTKYSGFDPGVSNYPTFARGVDRGLYPISRNIIMGLQLNF